MSTGSGGAYGRVPGQSAPYVGWGNGSPGASVQTAPAAYNNPVAPTVPTGTSNQMSQSYAPGRPYGFGGAPPVHPGLTQSAPPGSSAFTCSPPTDSNSLPNSSSNSLSAISTGPGASSDGIPEPPSRFPELESMPIADLRVLSDERAKFDDFISKHSHSRLIEGIVSSLRVDVEKLEAEQKEANRRREQAKDENISDIQHEIDELQGQVNDLQIKQDDWMSKHSADTIIQRLRTAIREAEAECERLENEMLAGDLDFDQFLKHYLECRKVYHERSLKIEQLKYERQRGIAVGR